MGYMHPPNSGLTWDSDPVKGMDWEPQIGKLKNTVGKEKECKDGDRYIPIRFLLYSWGFICKVPTSVPLSRIPQILVKDGHFEVRVQEREATSGQLPKCQWYVTWLSFVGSVE